MLAVMPPPPPARRALALAAPLLSSALALGCVDVPDRSPMGGDPMADADRPDPDEMPDGTPPDARRPEPPKPIDGDEPDEREVDGGEGGEVEIEAGRPGDAMPGPEGLPDPIRQAAPDPARCPQGGALLPGLGACVVVDALDPLPEARTQATGVALTDGRLVLVGGAPDLGTEPDGAVLTYDGEAWRAEPPLPLVSRRPQAVAVGDRVLVVGGEGCCAVDSAVQVVDPGGDGAPPAMLVQPRRRGFTVDALGDGRVVAAGGETLGGLAGAEVIDLEVERHLDPMLVPRRDHASAVDVDGALWVIGGVDTRGQVRFAPEVLHPGADGWVSMPGPARWATAFGDAAPTGDTILVAGGVDGDDRALSRAVVYDREREQWREVGGLNVTQSEVRLAALGDDGAVLAVGPSTVEVFDPVDEAFLTLPVDGAAHRTDPVVIADGGGVAVIGGSSQGRVLSLAYRVRLERALPPGEPGPADEPRE